ncbi:uncharacterized protein B0H18DRAFT_1030778 [Fomitopsis serialis]|uniref:uncharacterized protein n=1 Tax=Fomitopsis serialis TaxID=139415 RepID=UPI002008DAE6|nr:uncharacterized protein B0H18DRAFT_1030778 [Neoantrodia serialis]KAH9918618.1 hypothetical protein B0H18DRAFT_1030778 [Neoantrodia serialis]
MRIPYPSGVVLLNEKRGEVLCSWGLGAHGPQTPQLVNAAEARIRALCLSRCYRHLDIIAVVPLQADVFQENPNAPEATDQHRRNAPKTNPQETHKTVQAASHKRSRSAANGNTDAPAHSKRRCSSPRGESDSGAPTTSSTTSAENRPPQERRTHRASSSTKQARSGSAPQGAKSSVFRGLGNSPAASHHEEQVKSTDCAGGNTAVRALGSSGSAASSSSAHLASPCAAADLAPGASSAGLLGASGSLILGGTTAPVSGASNDSIPSNIPVTTQTVELQDATARLVSRCHNNAVQIASLQEQLEACKKDKSDLEVDVILMEVAVRAKEQERLNQVVQSHNEAIQELQSTLSDVTTVHEELQVRYDRLVRGLDSVTASIARP